jgi:tryptophan synthase beta subunit
MRRSVSWAAKQVQQTVMSRVSNLRVIARTGPSQHGQASAKPAQSSEEGRFVVGQSLVGGPDRVKGGT